MKFTPLALLLFFHTFLTAQEPVQKIPACFYAFDYVPGKETVDVQAGPEKFEEVRLSKANIVGPVTSIIVNGALQIHAKPVTVDGKVTHPVLSTAKIPVGISRALVVLFPDPKNPAEPYRSLVFNHDLKDFPLGDYRLINVSSHPVRGSIAKDFIEVKPGGISDLKPVGEPGSVVPVRFEYFDQDRWNLLSETRCSIRPDRRSLMCFYEDAATGRMNIRSIPDRSPVPPVATPAN